MIDVTQFVGSPVSPRLNMSAPEPLSTEQLCLDIYEETKRYPPIANLADMGFEILLGPPYREPPILFIGYQPGTGSLSAEECRLQGYENHWVTKVCQYAQQSWPLAARLQNIFDRELLAKCVGLNAIFVKAKDIKTYNSRVNINARREIEAFCLSRVERLVSAISPQIIFIIGFQTLDLFGGGVVSLTSRKGRPLMKTGEIFSRKAHAMMHLSGSRISNEDREAMKMAIHRELKTRIPSSYGS